MHAPSPPIPFLSPTYDRMIMVSWQEYPSIERVASPYMRLAGVRLEPRNRNKRDTSNGNGIARYANSYTLVNIADLAKIPIKLPAGACLKQPVWSADGERFAFQNVTADAVELWIGHGRTGEVRRVPDARLNPMFGGAMQWMPDQTTLIVKLVPEQTEQPPLDGGIPMGPSIQESDGEKGQSSTYENRDTLNSPHDEDVFDYYAASQLAFVDSPSLAIEPVGKVDRYWTVHPSPDGRHLLVTTIRRPYSYVTTCARFPRDIDVWDISNRTKGGVFVSQRVASLPLANRVPIHGVPLGPRAVYWRANVPATLVWAEALDGGDWKINVPARDKIMILQAPFSQAPTEITRIEQRYSSLQWGENPELALLTESDLNRRWRRTFIINFDRPEQKRRLLWDISLDEKYKNPGKVVYRLLANGFGVLYQDGNSIFLDGVGSSPEGDRPFLDRLNLETLKSERLFRSPSTVYEEFVVFDQPNTETFLTWRQSADDHPNIFRRTLQGPIEAPPEGEATFASESIAITHTPDPTPVVRQIKKRLISFKRDDGLEMSFTLCTPPGYQKGSRVPTILYAYPLDYANTSTAGQMTGSQSLFTKLHDYQFLLLAGYAIIDSASFPVIGDPQKAYDTYLEQLVANAKAAVDEAVRLGVTDPNRVGVTGHSHGALMTANLIAHSDIFQAGVATSGSYNKTNSPFGFQKERRSLWESSDVYMKVSPFFVADKIKRPLLLIHGADDANPGTPASQSSKLYEAIRGNGGTARLVLLPHEPHWYAAKESNEHLVWEMLNWFGKYVKNAPEKVDV
jgi:dipeptidyl aminopeptidase/acylaminoacyl peptidase